ncbi:hypothetical protein [Acetobacter pasteurianus]|nr:hypothetical protein [Acetobacter pasteurianus]
MQTYGSAADLATVRYLHVDYDLRENKKSAARMMRIALDAAMA